VGATKKTIGKAKINALMNASPHFCQKSSVKPMFKYVMIKLIKNVINKDMKKANKILVYFLSII
jgi:predicted sugar kinase